MKEPDFSELIEASVCRERYLDKVSEHMIKLRDYAPLLDGFSCKMSNNWTILGKEKRIFVVTEGSKERVVWETPWPIRIQIYKELEEILKAMSKFLRTEP